MLDHVTEVAETMQGSVKRRQTPRYHSSLAGPVAVGSVRTARQHSGCRIMCGMLCCQYRASVFVLNSLAVLNVALLIASMIFQVAPASVSMACLFTGLLVLPRVDMVLLFVGFG